LDATLAERQSRLVELEREAAANVVSEPDPRGDYLEKRLVQQIEKNHELTRALQEREKQIAAVARDKTLHEKSLAVLTQQLNDARAENERLATRLGGSDALSADALSADAPSAIPAPPAEDDWQRPLDADDLQAIRGIGRSFERRLNELGITRLSQIVNLGEEEIDWLERELDTFKGRIVRDDWVGQAAALIADSGELDRPLPPVPDTPQTVSAGAP
jgi:predicted flap endonuclease-1-like 5' DNA nuclease